MYEKSQSTEKPLEIQSAGNNRYFLRQNITECTGSDGNTYYEYEEKIIGRDVLDVIEHINANELKRESEIIDEYTEQLIAEGSL